MKPRYDRRYMDSLSVVLDHLKTQNQDTEFFVTDKGLLSMGGRTYLQANVKILRTYRFEGESDPADQAIVYVVQADDGRMGYCIDGYGMSSRHTSDLYHDFIQHAPIEHQLN